ncbi:MAG: hypothetical protein AAGE89_13670 [Pseudomonadota bacterium]
MQKIAMIAAIAVALAGTAIVPQVNAKGSSFGVSGDSFLTLAERNHKKRFEKSRKETGSSFNGFKTEKKKKKKKFF